MEKIRYKYRPRKHGVSLSAIVCPVCGGPINWVESIGNYHWNNTVVLLAECWDGKDGIKPRHLFLIHIEDGSLPIVSISRSKGKKSKEVV